MLSFRLSLASLVFWATSSAAWSQELLPGTKNVSFSRVCFAPSSTQLLAVSARPRAPGIWSPDALWLLDRVQGTSQVLFKPGQDQQVLAAAFSPDGKTIVAGGHCCWAGWRSPSLKEWFLIKGCPDRCDYFSIVALAAPHQGNTLAVNIIHRYEKLDGQQGSDSKLLLWNVNAGIKQEVFRVHKDKIINHVRINSTLSPSGRLLAFIDPTAKRLKVLETEPGDPIERAAFPLPDASEYDGSPLQFARDEGSVWRLDPNGNLTKFELKTKKARAIKLERDVGWFYLLPEEPALLAVRYVEKTKKNEVLFIRSSNGEVVTRITLPKVCHAYALSPDGRWLAGCASEGGIYLWDTHVWHKRRKGDG